MIIFTKKQRPDITDLDKIHESGTHELQENVPIWLLRGGVDKIGNQFGTSQN